MFQENLAPKFPSKGAQGWDHDLHSTSPLPLEKCTPGKKFLSNQLWMVPYLLS